MVADIDTASEQNQSNGPEHHDGRQAVTTPARLANFEAYGLDRFSKRIERRRGHGGARLHILQCRVWPPHDQWTRLPKILTLREKPSPSDALGGRIVFYAVTRAA